MKNILKISAGLSIALALSVPAVYAFSFDDLVSKGKELVEEATSDSGSG